MYIHEQPDWPDFTWNQSQLTALLAEVRHSQGRLLGRMESLGFRLREEATLQILTQDVVKTSEIEGEQLDTDQVRSSLARRMGIEMEALPSVDRNVEGIVEVMLDATRKYDAPLTQTRLFDWHSALFPTARSGLRRIAVGGWRTAKSGPMQVVSGPIGKEIVHYEAPESERLKGEMSAFLKWCNARQNMDPVIKAALAHFWFVTLHPFEDGNGRIARAIADLMLARSETTAQRFYSMSGQIQQERNDYYRVLERCQKGSLEITAWIEWFLNCLRRAIGASEKTLELDVARCRHRGGELWHPAMLVAAAVSGGLRWRWRFLWHLPGGDQRGYYRRRSGSHGPNHSQCHRLIRPRRQGFSRRGRRGFSL